MKGVLVKAAALTSILFVESAMAASDHEGARFQVYGTGGLSCGEWAEARRTDNEVQQDLIRQWVAGWFVSYGYYGSLANAKGVEVPEFATISLWLDTYCRNNPTHAVWQGASALVQQLGGKPTLHPWQR